MHNFSRPTTKVEENLVAVGKNLRSPKKEFFMANRAALEAAYNGYDTLAGKDLLHTVTRLWEITPEMDKDAKNVQQQKREKWLMACTVMTALLLMPIGNT